MSTKASTALSLDPDTLRQSESLIEQIQSVVDLVARQLAQPCAAFSLFDDRYAHYVVTHGLDDTDIRRSDVLCDIVYDNGQPLVSGDAASDPVLRQRSAIYSTGTRFYAGAPVLSSTGKKLGVLCCWGGEPMDEIPAHVTPLMTTSANLVGALVESDRTEAASSRQHNRLLQQLEHHSDLELILRQAAVLVNREGRIQYATAPFLGMIGRRAEEAVGLRVVSMLEATAPMSLESALDQAVQTGEPLLCTGRLRIKGQLHKIVDLKIFPSPEEGTDSELLGIRFLDPSELNPASQVTSQRIILLNMMRQGEPCETLLDPLLRMVQNQVRGSDNLAMISEITGPGSRTLHALPQAASFVEDVQGHHEFNPVVSICASTAEARHLFSCNDTLDESRWPNYDWLYFTYDIRSVWCAPILDPAGLIVGLVTVYRKEPGAPDKSDIQALEEAAEWTGMLLFQGGSGSSDLERKTVSAEYMERCLDDLRTKGRGKRHCYLLALDLADLDGSGLTAGYLEEVILLHLGVETHIFRLKPDAWYCLCLASDDPTMRGNSERLIQTLSLDRVSSTGYWQARVHVAFRKAETDGHILDQIAAVGRELLDQGSQKIHRNDPEAPTER